MWLYHASGFLDTALGWCLVTRFVKVIEADKKQSGVNGIISLNSKDILLV